MDGQFIRLPLILLARQKLDRGPGEAAFGKFVYRQYTVAGGERPVMLVLFTSAARLAQYIERFPEYETAYPIHLKTVDALSTWLQAATDRDGVTLAIIDPPAKKQFFAFQNIIDGLSGPRIHPLRN